MSLLYSHKQHQLKHPISILCKILYSILCMQHYSSKKQSVTRVFEGMVAVSCKNSSLADPIALVSSYGFLSFWYFSNKQPIKATRETKCIVMQCSCLIWSQNYLMSLQKSHLPCKTTKRSHIISVMMCKAEKMISS